MSEWGEVRLADLIQLSKDGEWGSAEAKIGSTVASVVRGTDFERMRRGDLQALPVRHITDRAVRLKRLSDNDIVIETAGGSKGRPTGRTVFARPGLVGTLGRAVVCASFSRFVRIDPDHAEPEYVYWFLQYLYCVGRMEAFNTQHTGVSRFQWTDFAAATRVSLPPRETQVGIARTLSAFDRLIEINGRRIEVLEDLARSLYREWFVRFRFPGHEHVELVDSDLGPIPAGWSVTTIAGLVEALTRGITPQYRDDGAWTVVNQKCIRNEQVDLGPARRQERVVPTAKQVRYGDVLINSTGVGTLGRVAMYLGSEPQLTADSHVTIARPSDHAARAWFGLHMRARQSEFKALGAGSTGQTELGRQAIGDLTAVVPTADVLARFGDVANPLLNAVPELLDQNRVLATTRDLLLPRLVTGRIDISEIDLGELLPAEMK